MLAIQVQIFVEFHKIQEINRNLQKKYFMCIHMKRSRDSSVGIATGYGLDDQEGREFESW
jgi:cystathionine beta-lyase family protein involved in aluminum resistance